MKELQYLNLYFKKYSGRLTLGLIITIIATIFIIIVPKIIGDIVDVVKNYLDNTITDIEIVKQELITKYCVENGGDYEEILREREKIKANVGGMRGAIMDMEGGDVNEDVIKLHYIHCIFRNQKS